MKLLYTLVLVAVTAFFALVPSVTSANAVLVGFKSGGKIFAIDEVSGEGTFLNSSGLGFINSAASNSKGSIYTVLNQNQVRSGSGRNVLTQLITVDPVTGEPTPVTDIGFADVRGLAFSPEDKLYAIFDGGRDYRSGAFLPDKLYTIDLSSGHLYFVGSTGATGLQSLAFSPDAKIFSWDVEKGLAILDITTGTATFIHLHDQISLPDIQALTFTPNGTLFGCNDSLFTINLTTGWASEVGRKGYSDIRGLVFLESELSLPKKPFFSPFLKLVFLMLFSFLLVLAKTYLDKWVIR
ncbi:MAG: hypothetical protein F6J86_02530 [Symploca sp. SIO1B1]|nr:hypothetical protein [Symploca sp. SIO1B1]